MQIISQSSPGQSKVRVSGALPHCSCHWRTWLIRSISWTGSWSGSGRSSPVALLSSCTPDRSHSGSPQSWTAELSTPVCLSSVLFRSWHTTDMSPLHLAVACKVDHLDFVADRKCKGSRSLLSPCLLCLLVTWSRIEEEHPHFCDHLSDILFGPNMTWSWKGSWPVARALVLYGSLEGQMPCTSSPKQKVPVW